MKIYWRRRTPYLCFTQVYELGIPSSTCVCRVNYCKISNSSATRPAFCFLCVCLVKFSLVVLCSRCFHCVANNIIIFAVIVFLLGMYLFVLKQYFNVDIRHLIIKCMFAHFSDVVVNYKF